MESRHPPNNSEVFCSSSPSPFHNMCCPLQDYGYWAGYWASCKEGAEAESRGRGRRKQEGKRMRRIEYSNSKSKTNGALP